jgi:hypothetical protein
MLHKKVNVNYLHCKLGNWTNANWGRCVQGDSQKNLIFEENERRLRDEQISPAFPAK